MELSTNDIRVLSVFCEKATLEDFADFLKECGYISLVFVALSQPSPEITEFANCTAGLDIVSSAFDGDEISIAIIYSYLVDRDFIK